MTRRLESAEERYLRQQVAQKLHGMVIKITAVVAGWPDDLVVLPGGRLHLVELKREGEQPSEVQVVMHQRLAKLGHKVHVLHGHKEIDEWVAFRYSTE